MQAIEVHLRSMLSSASEKYVPAGGDVPPQQDLLQRLKDGQGRSWMGGVDFLPTLRRGG